MRSISELVDTLSKEEKRAFIQYLKRKNRRGDAKNISLFKLIDGGQQQDLDIVLYGKRARNPYHALCKRLQDSLIDFIASKSFAGETSEELEILKLLLASRIFFEQKKYKIAFKTLEKAEKMAELLDVYAILNEILHTKIQYAHLNPNWSLPDIFTASDRNMALFQQDFQLNMAYASIKSELKNTKGADVNELVVKTFSKFHIAINEALTYKSLFQLMEITSTAAKLQSDYHTIFPFMTEIYAVIAKKGAIADKHRYYHIKILNLMAITHFRNKMFADSKHFALQMELEMQKDNGVYLKRFSEKLTVIKALNHNYTGQSDAAIVLLEEHSGNSLDIALILLMCLFQQQHFSDANKIVRQLSHTDAWYEKKMGWQWVLKKNIMEILLLIELDNLDMVLLKIQRFKRRFSKRLKDLGEQRVLLFVQLAASYYERPKAARSEAFKEEVEAAFEWVGKEREDIFVMSFYAWLKAKMEGENLYQTTLELVGQEIPT